MTEDVNPADLARHELRQCHEMGHDVGVQQALYAELERSGAPEESFEALLHDLEALGLPADSPWTEPAELDEILELLPRSEAPTSPDRAILADRVGAAWAGRVVGNMLGKPVEMGVRWTRRAIEEYLRSVDAYPLTDYVPVDARDADRLGFRENWPETTRGRVSGSSRDDDVDYTVLGLYLLETYGLDFTTADVAREWLLRFPFHQVYTAERATYRNLVNGVPPERAGRISNPYREWIGALIRADIFGYVSPGDPRRAAELAYRDARLSHTANGVYGEMWAAALVAAAFTAPDARSTVAESLRHLPRGSRLAAELRAVVADFDSGVEWSQAVAGIERRTAGMHWVHTINNAGAICAGVLWGSGDFTTTIALTVQAGMDTDSNGATAGSVAGILYGGAGIPQHWTDPLQDKVRSAVFGFDGVRISDLAARTLTLIDQQQ